MASSPVPGPNKLKKLISFGDQWYHFGTCLAGFRPMWGPKGSQRDANGIYLEALWGDEWKNESSAPARTGASFLRF